VMTDTATAYFDVSSVQSVIAEDSPFYLPSTFLGFVGYVCRFLLGSFPNAVACNYSSYCMRKAPLFICLT
jgi:hypothetical protein